MNQELMTLDFWQDTVIYEGKIFPIGTLACDALNVPADTLARMNEQCEKINLLLGMLNAGQDASALFPMAKEAVLTMVDILSETPPFSNMNIPKHRERIEKVFTADNALKYMEFAIKAATNSLQFEEIPNYADAMMLQRYTAVFGHLAYSLGEYQTAMLDFAEKSDGNEADRTAEGFARMFGSYFPPEFSITEDNAWMSTLNNSVQYVSVIRPGEKVAKLVKRIHYVSFVGMFRSDLFEGLCVGHAPKKCKICGKWFLTTNARHTKYCGGYAPGDKLHRTCRQIGNLKGREQRELADDHPVKLNYREQTLLEKRLAICMTCGHVGSWKGRPTFEELAVMFEGSTASGAERAYRRAVDKLTELLVAEGAIHAVRLKQKSKTKRKKKIATAIYEYQADCDGEWGQISFDFENGTSEIVRLADWDTMKTNRFANKAIAYLLNCENEKLPKETIVAFEL